MYLDVVELRSFYAGPLGAVASRLISRVLRDLWPDVTGRRILALGYATPFLGPFVSEAERVIAMMPAAQGVARWPREGGNLAALADERELPVPDASFDLVVAAHLLENSGESPRLLREIWRILAPQGRLLLIVPNRRGIWARLERTPFGFGRPFSRGQLTRLLYDSLFVPVRWAGALTLPPSDNRLMIKSLLGFERMGRRLGGNFAGVLIAEAEKTIYAAKRQPSRASVQRPVLIPR